MHLSSTEVGNDLIIVVGLNQHNLTRLRTKPIVLSQGIQGEVIPKNVKIILYGGKTESILADKLSRILSVLLGMMRHEKVSADIATSLSYERVCADTDRELPERDE